MTPKPLSPKPGATPWLPTRLTAAIRSELARPGRPGRPQAKGLQGWQIGLIVAGVGACVAALFAMATSSLPWGDQSSAPTPLAAGTGTTTPPARTKSGADAALSGAHEPSGAVALPGKGVILVVDDEPKRAPHKLGLFVYRPKAGRLQHLPLAWPARHKRRWDDWEGVAADGRHVVMMTSHAKRKGKRARLCRVPISAFQIQASRARLTQGLACVGGKRQRAAIKQLIADGSAAHGYTLASGWRHKGPKKGGLDMEGLLYDPPRKRFLIGLRGPLVQRSGKPYALFLAMKWGAGAPQFSVAGVMDFGGRGVRAMTRLSDGSVLISAGPVGHGSDFRLFRLAQGWPQTPFALAPKALPLSATLLRKVEAMAPWRGYLFLFRDDGDWYTDRRAHVRALSIKKVTTP